MFDFKELNEKYSSSPPVHPLIHPMYHVASDRSFRWGNSEPLTEDANPVRQTGTMPQQSPGRNTHTRLRKNIIVTDFDRFHGKYETYSTKPYCK